jgi:NlpC/P60 family
MLRALAAACCLASLATATNASAHVPHAHLDGSRAVAPRSAPDVVKRMIAAGNDIRHKPYRWGGGHRHWQSRGYDCSGAVSYVLHKAGLLDYPLDSTGFMHWGQKGASGWVKILANHDHAYMVVAGLRWDTSYITDGDRSGPGWSEQMRSSGGFHVRHPEGSRNW